MVHSGILGQVRDPLAKQIHRVLESRRTQFSRRLPTKRGQKAPRTLNGRVAGRSFPRIHPSSEPSSLQRTAATHSSLPSSLVASVYSCPGHVQEPPVVPRPLWRHLQAEVVTRNLPRNLSHGFSLITPTSHRNPEHANKCRIATKRPI